MKTFLKTWIILAVNIAAGSAFAAEINVLSAGAVEPGLLRVAEAFKRDSGHGVTVRFGTAPQLTKRLADGEAADILIAPPGLVETHVKSGKVRGEGRETVGRAGVGILVRTGVTPPDVASVEALKTALLKADSVVYNEASTGLYLVKLFDKMGISENLKSKSTRYANGTGVLEHLINGKGNEIGFGAIPEVKMYEAKGLKLVGPLPAEVQNYTSYVAAVMVAAASPEPAGAFIRYLVTPSAKAMFNAAGID